MEIETVPGHARNTQNPHVDARLGVKHALKRTKDSMVFEANYHQMFDRGFSSEQFEQI